jgi:uncharacterized membrane protein
MRSLEIKYILFIIKRVQTHEKLRMRVNAFQKSAQTRVYAFVLMLFLNVFKKNSDGCIYLRFGHLSIQKRI